MSRSSSTGEPSVNNSSIRFRENASGIPCRFSPRRFSIYFLGSQQRGHRGKEAHSGRGARAESLKNTRQGVVKKVEEKNVAKTKNKGTKRQTVERGRRSRDPAIIPGRVTCTRGSYRSGAKWNYSTWNCAADRGGHCYPFSTPYPPLSLFHHRPPLTLVNLATKVRNYWPVDVKSYPTPGNYSLLWENSFFTPVKVSFRCAFVWLVRWVWNFPLHVPSVFVLPRVQWWGFLSLLPGPYYQGSYSELTLSGIPPVFFLVPPPTCPPIVETFKKVELAFNFNVLSFTAFNPSTKIQAAWINWPVYRIHLNDYTVVNKMAFFCFHSLMQSVWVVWWDKRTRFICIPK